MTTILCYGDSNTYGSIPGSGNRFSRDERWPGVMRRRLGPAVEVIEEGLSGRTTVWDDPFVDGRNGLTYLRPCLAAHAPIDLVVLMLGTNDLKSIFRLTAADIVNGLASLLDEVAGSRSGPSGPPSLLLVAPVPIDPSRDLAELWGFREAGEASMSLARLSRSLARHRGCDFFAAGDVAAVSAEDGIHLDAVSHERLGEAIAAQVGHTLGLSA